MNLAPATTPAPSRDEPLKIRGVISDLNGTLDTIEWLRNRLWPMACKIHGFPNHESHEFLPTLGATAEEVVDVVIGVVLRNTDLALEDARRLVQKIRETRNLLVSQNLPDAPEARADWLRQEGAEELVRFLQEREVRFVVATASKKSEAEPILRLTRLADLVPPQLVVAACDIPKEKRNKVEIVREAQRRIEIPMDQCIGLEDSDRGILAMSEAGCWPVHIKGLKALSPEATSKVAQSHRNLLTTKAWLASLDFDSRERAFIVPQKSLVPSPA